MNEHGITNYGEIINDLEIERDAAIARAEATEKELESALAIVDLYQERMFTAEKRVAELEAADRWRPVTKPPTDNETQCLLRKFTKRWGYEYKIASWTSYYENPWKGITERDPGGYWLDDEGEDIDIDDWQEWQPLPAIPAPPQDNPASGRHEGEE